MVSFYSLSFSVLVRAFCCDDDDEDDDDDMKQRESFESSLLSAFSVFLNFSPKPTHSDTTDDKEGEKNERRGFF